ncbi:MAG TPA: ABC-F family ATP-binding cassette domain-containing protein [Anaerolineaceae bacterium]
MLSVHDLSKSYGIQPVFAHATFTVNAGDRVGLVGPNGCGKTTLLRIVAGQMRPDSGAVTFTPANLRVGYLPQGYEFDWEDTIETFLTRMEGDLPALEERLLDLAQMLGDDPDQEAVLAEYDSTLERLNAAAAVAGRSPQVLSALGLDHFSADTPVGMLSGGQKTRLALAGVLLSSPQLLLLDEPTNHLDIEMLEWLEDWLLDFPGGVLVVSHDRALLDAVATSIVEMEGGGRGLQPYEGNYTAYLEQKLAERERQMQAYQDQQAEISRLRGAAEHVRSIARFRKGGKADSGDKFAKGFFANRGLETVRRAKAIEKRIERLQTVDRIDRPARTWQMRVDFTSAGESGRDVLALEDLAVGYNGLPLLEHINLVLRYGARAALIGPNGAGKTTLIRAIAGVLPPVAGSVRLGSRVRLGYMTQEQEGLNPAENALETLRAVLSQNDTEVRSFLSKFLFTGDDVFTPVSKLSYGERARLLLALLAAQGCNLLLLDEPINHLDIPSRARFEEALGQFEGTALAVVHDRFFIEGFATEIWHVENRTIRVERRE